MIKILNDDFKVIDILRKYTFAQYEECFREIGSFKINAQITETNLFLLEKKKFYVLFDNDIFGEITKVEKDSDGEYEKTILIEGKMSLILLTRRVINSIIKFKGKTYQLVNELIVQNLTNDETSKRYVNIDLKYDNEEYLQTISSEVNKQLTGGYVWDNIYDLLEQDKMGIIFNPIVEPTKTINDIETNITSWEMKISAGVDRRKGNIYNNEAVVFSQSLSNIQRTAYNYETGDYKNVAYVAGEGEGTSRKWYEIYVSDEEKEQKGWKRKELWIDARDIQSEDGEKQLTDEEYETLIKQRANEKFPENSEIESYTATIVESNKQFIYGKDYFLGDLVTVIDNELGIEIDAQVTKVTISEQGNRKITDTEFTYGTIKRNPIEEIKIMNKNIEKHENDIKYLENSLVYISPIIKKMYLMFHPIGDIVMNISGNNPGDIFGGTWVEWGKGRVPVGVDESQEEFKEVEKTGGEKEHELTLYEIPSHRHSITRTMKGTLGSDSTTVSTDGHSETYDTVKSGSSGGGTAHNNLQPYITCYYWKRTE